MCYAIPGKVIEVDGDYAVVDYGGVTKRVNAGLVDARVGDSVLVHAGFVIEKLDEMSAKEALEAVNMYLSRISGRA